MPVALVTGSGGGIGAAVCRALAPDHLVVAAGRNRERLEATVAAVRDAGGEARAVVFDVTDPEGTETALREVREQAGPPTCLVANAGIAVSAPVGSEGHEALLRRHLEVDYLGAVRLLELLVPEWKRAGGGRAVLVASSAALRGYAYVSAYAAAKHALLGYGRSAAPELAKHRIAVHVVCPHYVDSPMTEASAARIAERTGRSGQEARALLASENPGGRLVTPDEVAAATLELVRAERTGVVLELTGGEAVEREAGRPLP